MTIASQIQDYADGLSDAYDMVAQRGGTMPQRKNMQNLDTAIATIPSGGGGGATTFYLDDDFGVASHIYTDSGLATYATATDINDALDAGPVIISSGSDSAEITVFNKNGGMSNTGQWEFLAYPTTYTFSFVDSTSIVWDESDYQPMLTAGSNITISGTTISATDTTYSDFTGATSSIAGSNGLVPAPASGDQDKFLAGDGTWKAAGGASATTFYFNVIDNVFYKDSQYTEAATPSDIFTAFDNGYTVFQSSGYTFEIVSAYPAADTFTAIDSASIGGNLFGTLLNYTYDSVSDSWVETSGAIVNKGMTGATSSTAGSAGMVPAPAAGDQDKALKGDGTWGDVSEKFVIMKYGEANAWAKFLAAYQSNAIVYCRASSNSNPATGSQTRLAFMAYVSNETTPTNVEFQYVRSVGTKTSSQPVDQVFVYKLENTNGGTWSVQTRDMAPKIAAGTGINVSYSNGTYTISLA